MCSTPADDGDSGWKVLQDNDAVKMVGVLLVLSILLGGVASAIRPAPEPEPIGVYR